MSNTMAEVQPGKSSIVLVTRGSFKISVEDPGRSQFLNVQSCDEAEAPTPNLAAAAAAKISKVSVEADPGRINVQSCHEVETNLAAKMSKVYYGKRVSHWVLMTVSSLILLLGFSAATLLGRLYFVHGGSQRWLYTCMQSAGWPVLLPPLLIYYCVSANSSARPTPISFKLFSIYLAMGFFTAFDNLLFSWGLSYLPVSTNALLSASQLAFNAVFAYAIVGQKITQYVVNSVFAITVGAALLGVHAGSDRPAGTTEKQYVLGFIVTIGGAALFALMLPLMELTYRKVIGKTNFAVVLEAQMAIAIFATIFSMVGMGINGEFGAIKEEAMSFTLGPFIYSVTLVGSAIGWQMFFLGGAGIIFLASSLMSCVFSTAMLPLVSILAVIFFQDSFSALKAIAMLLSIWGFISYIYGGYLHSKSQAAVQPEILDQSQNV